MGSDKLEFGELSENEDLVNKYENLNENLDELQKVLDNLLPVRMKYDQLTLAEQIELDLFLAYTLNSLQWVHLRIQGIDPNNHPIKDEIQRVKAVMRKWQEVQDREKRPTVDIEAAKRFVRSGLYNPYKGTGLPPNKKIKFEEKDE